MTASVAPCSMRIGPAPARRPPSSCSTRTIADAIRWARCCPACRCCCISADCRQALVVADTWKDLCADRRSARRSSSQRRSEEFNDHAAAGVDPLFGRGSSAYDRFYGDPKVAPNPNLAPLATPPFYAIPIVAGDIGTNGGLRTNEHAQVLAESGEPIAGLYATGNTTASVMGHSYPGAGATLGPAMTFGFIAARHACGATRG